MKIQPPFEIAGIQVPAGQRATVNIPVVRRYTHAEVALPVHVVHGRFPGPTLFVSAAIHGDELTGVEVTRRVLARPALRKLSGTLLAVPVVNVFGFTSHSRYLPDRRDLNRTFPGSPSGSMTARLAHVFMQQIVARSTHGIDLHSGALHRANLPQIRACLEDPETERLARAFSAPVIIDANLRDGSLRQAVLERQLPMLLYEGGEALRFDEVSIRAGVRGVLAVMRAINMLPERKRLGTKIEPVLAKSSAWVRAPESGVLRGLKQLGDSVRAGDVLGVISDPLGETEVEIRAPAAGIVIAQTRLPLVNEGDAVCHIATFEHVAVAAEQVQTLHAELEPNGTPTS